MIKYIYRVQMALSKTEERKGKMTRAQYLRKMRKEEEIFKVLKLFAIVETIIAIVVLTWGEKNIRNLEESYPSTGILMQERIPLRKQLSLYLDALEVPKELLEQDYEEPTLVVEQQDVAQVFIETSYYSPTEEEVQWAYLIAKSEAGIEDSLGQTLVIDVAINHMKESGYSNLIEEFTASGRYSSVIDGVPCIKQNGKWTPVTEDMLTDELKEAVHLAFEKDYTEQLLKEAAQAKGLDETYYEGGALYFYNPKAVSEHQAELRANIKVAFQHGRHIFYRIWNQ